MANSSLTPIARLTRLLVRERGDLVVLTVYTLGVILLTLAVPLAMQALVNTVAAGLFLQPLVVLSLLVLGGLAIAGVLQLMQLGVVENLQQRVFAHSALEVAERLYRVRSNSLRGDYAPELVNRFFDVLTIQKALSKLLLDGFTAVLQAAVGLLVLGFYSPMLLVIDFILITVFVGGTLLLGIGGLRTSLVESKYKYKVAEWLEDVARCHVSLKLHGSPNFVQMKSDEAVEGYLNARRGHFRINLRQMGGTFFLVAVANAGVLAAGGWQVLNGNLTLGQLVAAQIIVTLILTSFDKLIRQTDKFFDLLTGLDKVGVVEDLPSERMGGTPLPVKDANSGASVSMRRVRFNYNEQVSVLIDLNLEIPEGERVSLVGASGAGKSTIAALLCGLEDPTLGTVLIDGIDLRDVDLLNLRRYVSLAGYDKDLFDGTIEENIRIGREHVTVEDVRWALELARLADDVALMPDGIKSRVISGGGNLSRGQIQRLLIARAIVDRPRLLILDEAFTGLDERISTKILDAVFAEANKWTIIDISHDPEVVLRTEKVHVLADGSIKEKGSPVELAQNELSEFSQLFPFLCRALRSGVRKEESR